MYVSNTVVCNRSLQSCFLLLGFKRCRFLCWRFSLRSPRTWRMPFDAEVWPRPRLPALRTCCAVCAREEVNCVWSICEIYPLMKLRLSCRFSKELAPKQYFSFSLAVLLTSWFCSYSPDIQALKISTLCSSVQIIWSRATFVACFRLFIRCRLPLITSLKYAWVFVELDFCRSSNLVIAYNISCLAMYKSLLCYFLNCSVSLFNVPHILEIVYQNPFL